LLGWAAIVAMAAREMAQERPFEAIHPLKYLQHGDIRVCLAHAIVVLACAALAALLSLVVRPCWRSLVLLLVATIACAVLFQRYLGWIT
jgi:Flp pilus assembly protein TadB